MSSVTLANASDMHNKDVARLLQKQLLQQLQQPRDIIVVHIELLTGACQVRRRPDREAAQKSSARATLTAKLLSGLSSAMLRLCMMLTYPHL